MTAIKLSVFIVSYNQEEYITQAIESVVQQSVLPYEIVISDDYSTDNTWHIIKDFSAQYPDLIKAYRNESNVGVYKNFNKATHLVTGNLITCVAGDDYINPGYYEAIYKFIHGNQLDPDKDSFMIVPNIIKLLNGAETKYSNLWCARKNLKKLSLRGLIDDRYGIVSRPSLNTISDFMDNIGIYADFIWNMERYIKTEKVFFMEGYYPVYRIGVGTVSRTKETDAAISLNKALEITKQRFQNEYDASDLRYIEYLRRKNNYIIKKTLNNYVSLAYYTFINTGNFYSWKKQIKALIFIFLPKKLKNFLFKINYFKMLSK